MRRRDEWKIFKILNCNGRTEFKRFRKGYPARKMIVSYPFSKVAFNTIALNLFNFNWKRWVLAPFDAQIFVNHKLSDATYLVSLKDTEKQANLSENWRK